jgi:hypothetical protein
MTKSDAMHSLWMLAFAAAAVVLPPLVAAVDASVGSKARRQGVPLW